MIIKLSNSVVKLTDSHVLITFLIPILDALKSSKKVMDYLKVEGFLKPIEYKVQVLSPKI
jgi:hypothetical protein